MRYWSPCILHEFCHPFIKCQWLGSVCTFWDILQFFKFYEYKKWAKQPFQLVHYRDISDVLIAAKMLNVPLYILCSLQSKAKLYWNDAHWNDRFLYRRNENEYKLVMWSTNHMGTTYTATTGILLLLCSYNAAYYSCALHYENIKIWRKRKTNQRDISNPIFLWFISV